MTEILHPFLTKFRQILRGILDQYFLEKECFRSSFYSPGKSGIARPPHGMKLGNTFSGQECSPRLINKYEELGNIMIDKGKFTRTYISCYTFLLFFLFIASELS